MEKRKFLSSTFSTVNPTGIGLCSNPDCSNEIPVSNRLNYDLTKAIISTGGLRKPFGSVFLSMLSCKFCLFRHMEINYLLIPQKWTFIIPCLVVKYGNVYFCRTFC